MTPEERIARLEERDRTQNERLGHIEAKLDRLIEQANMGKGAWLAILKVGGVLLALASGLAWIFDRIPHK